jgi:hypothetical protein
MRENIVLFGDSITEQSFRENGWGASLANAYSRKLSFNSFSDPLIHFPVNVTNKLN